MADYSDYNAAECQQNQLCFGCGSIASAYDESAISDSLSAVTTRQLDQLQPLHNRARPRPEAVVHSAATLVLSSGVHSDYLAAEDCFRTQAGVGTDRK